LENFRHFGGLLANARWCAGLARRMPNLTVHVRYSKQL
jgi:hypothetical protein